MTDDREFEAWLRRFPPQAPRPLPMARRRWFARRPSLAAAAALLLVAGVVLLRERDHGVRPIPTIVFQAPARAVRAGELHVLARIDPERLEAMLDGEARRLLPDVERSTGALRVLGAE